MASRKLLWGVAIRCRVALWIPDDHWEVFLNEMQTWPPELRESTFYYHVWASRLCLQSQTGLPWELMVSGQHQRRRRAILHQMEQIGLVSVARPLGAPSVRGLVFSIDGSTEVKLDAFRRRAKVLAHNMYC